jgi:hypothetical protein
MLEMKNSKEIISSSKKKYTIISLERDIVFTRESSTLKVKLTKHELLKLFEFLKTAKIDTAILRTANLVKRKQATTITFLLYAKIIEEEITA